MGARVRLRDRFLRLYHLDRRKEGRVEENGSIMCGVGNGNGLGILEGGIVLCPRSVAATYGMYAFSSVMAANISSHVFE
ncbi:hypothetical protein Tco_0331497, partial [Tanacetum coccineum]